MSQQANALAFFTDEQLLEELKKRSKTLFFAYEPLVDRDLDWGYTWKGEKERYAIALADEAIFKMRFDRRPIEAKQE